VDEGLALRFVAIPHQYRLLRFAMSGAAAALVQLGMLAGLTGRGAPPVPADLAAFLAAAQVNFALSQSFTWGDRRLGGSLVARWAAFHLAIAGTALVNIGVFALAHHWAPAVIAAALGIAVAAAINFAVGDRVVFAAAVPARSRAPAARG
jgi:putative flippase GtrA